MARFIPGYFPSLTLSALVSRSLDVFPLVCHLNCSGMGHSLSSQKSCPRPGSLFRGKMVLIRNTRSAEIICSWSCHCELLKPCSGSGREPWFNEAVEWQIVAFTKSLPQELYPFCIKETFRAQQTPLLPEEPHPQFWCC